MGKPVLLPSTATVCEGASTTVLNAVPVVDVAGPARSPTGSSRWSSIAILVWRIGRAGREVGYPGLRLRGGARAGSPTSTRGSARAASGTSSGGLGGRLRAFGLRARPRPACRFGSPRGCPSPLRPAGRRVCVFLRNQICRPRRQVARPPRLAGRLELRTTCRSLQPGRALKEILAHGRAAGAPCSRSALSSRSLAHVLSRLGYRVTIVDPYDGTGTGPVGV